MAETRNAAVPPVSRSTAQSGKGLAVTPDLIDVFLMELEKKGRTGDTVTIYRRNLSKLYGLLPAGKRIGRGTLEDLRETLLETGCAPGTANSYIAAANSLLEYCGRRDLQLGPLKQTAGLQPELTRNEYLRLLSTARALGRERAYLLVKVFVSTGLMLRDLPRLTVDAADAGKLVLSTAVIHIPEGLREELLDYAKREGVVSGPLFVTRTGRPLARAGVNAAIQALCRDARVPEEKANPRCLKKLYQATQASIRANVSLLVEQVNGRLLETEQLAIGWKRGET